MVRTWMTAVAAAVCLGVAGCVDMGAVEAMRDEAAQLRDELRARGRAWADRLEGMSPDDPRRPGVESALLLARERREALERGLAEVDAVIGRAKNPGDPLGVGGLAPFLPEPVRVPVLLGAALAASLLRAGQLKRGLASVARGLEKAMEEDQQFKERFRRHANTFRTIQTRTARRIVDEATGDRPMLRLPI